MSPARTAPTGDGVAIFFFPCLGGAQHHPPAGRAAAAAAAAMMEHEEGDSRADSLSRKTVHSLQKRSGLLKHQLQLVKSANSDRYEIAPIQDTLSFEKGFFLFIRAVQLLTQHMEGVVVVGLAGPSGAGKTVFTEKVSAFMPGIAMISMDNYNDATRVIDGNYDGEFPAPPTM